MTNKKLFLTGAGVAFVTVLALLVIKGVIQNTSAGSINPGVEQKLQEQFYGFQRYKVGQNPLPPVVLYNSENLKVHSDTFKGQYLMLNMWATWCPGCVQELPSLAKLSEHFSDRDLPVQVIAVSLDRNKDIKDINEFLLKYDVGALASYHDTDRSLARAYPVNGMPTTLLIDSEGNIIYEMMGEADWQEDDIVKFLEAEIRPDKEMISVQNSP